MMKTRRITTNALRIAGMVAASGLLADSSGKATLSAELDMLSLTEGPTGILKRSVVIHADPDDYKSQPAGNSGKRVACGVIRTTAAGGGY